MIDAKFKVRRYIAEYSKETDELLAEHDLSSFTLSKFQVEFDESNKENPMFECYPVKNNHIEFLKKHIVIEPDWDFVNKFYFLEAHSK